MTNTQRLLSRHAPILLAISVLVGLAGASLLAHEVTYKGTVIAVEKDKVRVSVTDAKTKKLTAMAFDVDGETKVFRGDAAVKFAEAHIVKGETIAVTVNLDDDATLANVIRLAVVK
jgi:hypothetical protein